jgi:hypothetical protein
VVHPVELQVLFDYVRVLDHRFVLRLVRGEPVEKSFVNLVVLYMDDFLHQVVVNRDAFGHKL